MTNVDLPTFSVLSLCSGGGGLERGVSLAIGNARVICSVEHEAYAIEILASQMENGYLDAAPIWTDLRTFYGRPWRGIVDCIIAGYPCQPFSVAGKGAGTDDPRHLWPHIARIIGEVEPELCFFENVPGHLALGFDEVRDSLTGMGYRVAAGLFSAEEVGAPHKRERLFILAHANGSGNPQSELQHSALLAESSRTVGDSTSVRLGAACEATSEDRSDGRRLQEPERGSRTVADAGHYEPPGRIHLATDNDRCSGAGCESRSEFASCFPPAPNDTEGWMRLLEADPSLEPAICVLAHGMADRADQLRVLGNGVVPLQAAYAFLSLYACLRGAE